MTTVDHVPQSIHWENAQFQSIETNELTRPSTYINIDWVEIGNGEWDKLGSGWVEM